MLCLVLLQGSEAQSSHPSVDGDFCILFPLIILGSQCNFWVLSFIILIFSSSSSLHNLMSYSHVFLSVYLILLSVPLYCFYSFMCVSLVHSGYYLMVPIHFFYIFPPFIMFSLSFTGLFGSKNIYYAIGLVSLSRSVLQLCLWLSKLFSLSFCLYHSSLYKLHQT